MAPARSVVARRVIRDGAAQEHCRPDAAVEARCTAGSAQFEKGAVCSRCRRGDACHRRRGSAAGCRPRQHSSLPPCQRDARCRPPSCGRHRPRRPDEHAILVPRTRADSGRPRRHRRARRCLSAAGGLANRQRRPSNHGGDRRCRCTSARPEPRWRWGGRC